MPHGTAVLYVCYAQACSTHFAALPKLKQISVAFTYDITDKSIDHSVLQKMLGPSAVTGTAAVSSAANAGVAVASCSTHSVAAAAAVVAAADVTSWCKRKRYSSGPEDAHDSYTHPSAPKQGRHAAQQHQQQQQSATATGRNVYIKLADESPPRSDADSDVDSVYGSFHGLETGECLF